jgi:hypothetical protein
MTWLCYFNQDVLFWEHHGINALNSQLIEADYQYITNSALVQA